MTSVISFLFLVFNCTLFCCSLKVFTFISFYLFIFLSLYLFFFNFLIFSSFISFLFSFSSILSPLLSFSRNSEAFHLTSACQLRSPPSLPPSPPGPAGALVRGLGGGVVPGFALPSPGMAAGCLPPLQVRRGVLGSIGKNGDISYSPGKPGLRRP